jgi:hypothetical protein
MKREGCSTHNCFEVRNLPVLELCAKFCLIVSHLIYEPIVLLPIALVSLDPDLHGEKADVVVDVVDKLIKGSIWRTQL